MNTLFTISFQLIITILFLLTSKLILAGEPIYRVDVHKNRYEIPMNLACNQDKVRNAIAILIPKVMGERIPRMLKNIDAHLLDDNKTTVMLFVESYPFERDIAAVRASTKRCVDFINIKLLIWRLPQHQNFNGFRDATFHKREKWSYSNMIRFWFHDIFELKVMENVAIYMRIDDDSCVTNGVAASKDPFQEFETQKLVYVWNEVDPNRRNII